MTNIIFMIISGPRFFSLFSAIGQAEYGMGHEGILMSNGFVIHIRDLS